MVLNASLTIMCTHYIVLKMISSEKRSVKFSTFQTKTLDRSVLLQMLAMGEFLLNTSTHLFIAFMVSGELKNSCLAGFKPNVLLIWLKSGYKLYFSL